MIRTIKNLIFAILTSSMLPSCQEGNIHNVNIRRFDKAMIQWAQSSFDNTHIAPYVADTSDYFRIYSKGVWGFEGDMSDLWLERLKATLQNEAFLKLCLDTEVTFSDIGPIQVEIANGLTLMKQLLPKIKSPTSIYTHISGLQQSMIIAPDFVSIALDKYLGADYPMYQSYFYEYQRRTMSSEYMARDLFRLLILDEYPNLGGTLFDRMTYEGKIIFTLSKILPNTPLETILGYSKEQIQWCKKNEKSMWNYLISEDYLYSEEINLLNKFLGEGAFTNDFGEESPAKAISWIAYSIVNQYMKRSSDHLEELFTTDAQTILKVSKYKY